MPVSPAWPAVESAINQELERAFYGTATLDEALTKALEKATAEFVAVK